MTSSNQFSEALMAKNKYPQKVKSGYSAIPHCVQDHPAFQALSFSAKALLLEVLRQHNGRNNGHYQLVTDYLEKRGWKSSSTIQKAKKALLTAEFIVQTKQGGLGTGPCLFAVTWYGIDEWSGLDLQRHEHRLGAWHIKTPKLQPSRIDSFESRIAANANFEISKLIPVSNIESPGGKTSASPTSEFENNVITITQANLKTRRVKRAVVGKRGKSGVRKERAPVSAEAPKGPLAIWRIGKSS